VRGPTGRFLTVVLLSWTTVACSGIAGQGYDAPVDQDSAMLVAVIVPRLDAVGLRLVPLSAVQDVFEASNNGRARGYAAFSLPGYSRDGHAVVYGMFTCGSTCGYTWLFLLRQEPGWHVVSCRMLTIS